MLKKRKGKYSNTPIIFLAYFHRYGLIALMILLEFITKTAYPVGICSIAFAIWIFIGYIFRWKHIYCSYQNACHIPMTPKKINWNTVKKSDALGVPAFFLIIGIALLAALK